MSKKPEKDVSRETMGTDSAVQSQPDNAKAAPQPDKQGSAAKPRQPAPVFIYLAILFAAAFLMLLLAYLVQQRNSENTIDDLRTSMTATREELMEQNRVLQEEKEGLETELNTLNDQLNEITAERDKYEQDAQMRKETAEGYSSWQNSYKFLETFWFVEELYVKGDYESCAETFKEWYHYRVPYEVLERAEEIRDDLTRRGFLEKGAYDELDVPHETPED